jgi:chromosome segregation ATPase
MKKTVIAMILACLVCSVAGAQGRVQQLQAQYRELMFREKSLEEQVGELEDKLAGVRRDRERISGRILERTLADKEAEEIKRKAKEEEDEGVHNKPEEVPLPPKVEGKRS